MEISFKRKMEMQKQGWKDLDCRRTDLMQLRTSYITSAAIVASLLLVVCVHGGAHGAHGVHGAHGAHGVPDAALYFL